MLILVKLLAKYIIIIYALGWYMKSSESIKTVQSHSTVEIPGRARRGEQLRHSKLK